VTELLSQVVPLALGAAISPVLFLLQVNTLAGPRPISRGAALTAGAAVTLIIVSTIGVLVGDTGFSDNTTLQAWINIAFGALLIAVGIRALVKPPKQKESKSADDKSAWRSFLAGVAGMASNLTTFALYIPALALIAASGLPLRQQGVAALVILFVTLMVAWVPLLIAIVVPATRTRLLPAVGGWMNRNDRWIQVVLGFGFGAWLLWKGISGL
jgi:threonine/homoserine/homoserine lactone efflux protein